MCWFELPWRCFLFSMIHRLTATMMKHFQFYLPKIMVSPASLAKWSFPKNAGMNQFQKTCTHPILWPLCRWLHLCFGDLSRWGGCCKWRFHVFRRILGHSTTQRTLASILKLGHSMYSIQYLSCTLRWFLIRLPLQCEPALIHHIGCKDCHQNFWALRKWWSSRVMMVSVSSA